MTPLALIRLLKALKKPDVIDLCLIGVDPEWLNRGVSIVVSAAALYLEKDYHWFEWVMLLFMITLVGLAVSYFC